MGTSVSNSKEVQFDLDIGGTLSVASFETLLTAFTDGIPKDARIRVSSSFPGPQSRDGSGPTMKMKLEWTTAT